MSFSLINELKSEHQQLLLAFQEIDGLGINSMLGRQKLIKLGRFLENHFKKENAGVYMLLEKIAENDSNVMMMLYRNNRDLEDISDEIRSFFRFCTRMDAQEICKDRYAMVKEQLKARIDREELFIFESFLNVVSNMFDRCPAEPV
ncbi:MAG: hypothetical protein HQL67_02735 [Magnetococcales bacterium]|nr:hypothetical protein [Magnetococcales bacterium]